MVLLVCKQLILGVHPSVVPSSIMIMYHVLHGIFLDEVPSISFVRQRWTVVEVILTTYVACRIVTI